MSTKKKHEISKLTTKKIRIASCSSKNTKKKNCLLNTNDDLKHLEETFAGCKSPLKHEISHPDTKFQLVNTNAISFQSELEKYVQQKQEDPLNNFNENHIISNCCCILCFYNDEKCGLIDLRDNQYFLTLIKELTSVEIIFDDNYLTKICDKCSMDLEYFNKFKITCIKNSMILKEKMIISNKASQLSKIVPLFNSNIDEKILIHPNIKEELVKEIIIPNTEIQENINQSNLSLNEEMNEPISVIDKKVPKKRKINFSTKKYWRIKSRQKRKQMNIEEKVSEDTQHIEDISQMKNNDNIENQENEEKMGVNLNEVNLNEVVPIARKRKFNRAKLPCHICGKMFTSFEMKYHPNIHNNIRPFACTYEDCKKTFAIPRHLRQHIRFHSLVKRYKCTECDTAFQTISGLTIHQSYHGDPKLPCKICGKMLRNRKAMQRHMMTHTNERKYPCEECEKSFITMYTLRVHRRVHTKEKPFLCSKCGESFAYKCLLTAHTERYHPAD